MVSERDGVLRVYTVVSADEIYLSYCTPPGVVSARELRAAVEATNMTAPGADTLALPFMSPLLVSPPSFMSPLLVSPPAAPRSTPVTPPPDALWASLGTPSSSSARQLASWHRVGSASTSEPRGGCSSGSDDQVSELRAEVSALRAPCRCRGEFYYIIFFIYFHSVYFARRSFLGSCAWRPRSASTKLHCKI